MHPRSSPILTLAFGSLLILVGLAGFLAFRKGYQIYREVAELYEAQQRLDQTLASVRANVFQAAIFVRDYLLDPSHITGTMHREQLLKIRSSMTKQLDELEGLMTGPQDAAALKRLSEELDAYWKALDPLFEWTPQQKMALSSFFLRKTVLPRRNAVLSMAREIRALNDETWRRQKEALEQRQRDFTVEMAQLLGVALFLGIAVAIATIIRVIRLERRAEEARTSAERAESELRRLSQQLVRAQEEERKSISRELHDEVGQMLTALRVELGTLERLRFVSESEFHSHLSGTKQLVEQTLRVVRDMAMGLRPSMLDDLGLQPALEWQARDFSRRFGVPVNLQLEGTLDTLPERHRTCVFRVIQEALTNCARHARANEIRIAVHGHRDGLLLTVQDDGVGIGPPGARRRGLGLIGIEERVRELGGTVRIYSQSDKGTVLSVELPFGQKEAHEHTRAAG